jgi:hypothetical protein
MRVITVSNCDDEGIEDGEPLLVARVDGAMIRRLLAIVADELAAPTEGRPGPRQVVPMRAASPPAPASESDRNDP